MLIMGHRGAPEAAPENSLAGFAAAAAMGAAGVELDVRRTADGAMALSHDDTLADGRVVVEHTMADLAGSLTDLASALDVCVPLDCVNIEIKNWPDDRDWDPGAAVVEAVVALLAARGELDSPRYLVSAFHLGTLDRVHELAPALATGWLLGLVDDPAPLVEKAAEHGHSAVHPHHVFVNEAFVERAHGSGLQLNTWTCNDPDRIRWLAQLGVDALITDHPDVALKALADQP